MDSLQRRKAALVTENLIAIILQLL